MLACKKIENVVFVAEFRGVKFANQIMDKCRAKNSKNLNIEKLAEELFSEIFIEPKNLSFDFFDGNFKNPQKAFDDAITFGKDIMLYGGEKKLSKRKTKAKVKEEWAMWRLILSEFGQFDYDYVFNKMTPQEVAEANAAIDIAIERSNKKR
jgi:hypothetical protein